MVFRLIADKMQWNLHFPENLVEFFGSIGLIMIVLEAGLDLRLGADKKTLIRNSFFAALFILIISILGVAAIIHYALSAPFKNCLVYAIPLSIMSSSIVIPSLHHLTAAKKEFLVYEASFSDILGILFFNLLTENAQVSFAAVGGFGLNIVIAIVLSIIFSAVLFLILNKSRLNVKFFLVFALLIILYEGGKMMHLPSLIIILVFGLLMNNWQLIHIPVLRRIFVKERVSETNMLLHALTAESSFLIRTFFFILFGFSINLQSIADDTVIVIGSCIVAVLLLSRFLYLRFFLRESVYPEVLFIPRGLITILLFYKIPASFKFSSFSEGILFFVILLTSFVMMFGIIFYKRKDVEAITEIINADQ
jgi:Kef-type K+ transport system membrane component KefB